MVFNKCERCGAFFATEDSVCPNCKSKDQVDLASIQRYIDNNGIPNNVDDLAFHSGVSVKNLNRLIDSKEELVDVKNFFHNT